MKKIAILLMLVFVNISILFAQAPPQGINYQAVVYSDNGNNQPGLNVPGQVLRNKNIRVRFTIIQDLATGTEVYKEAHTATTDAFGMFSLVIGEGTPQGSSVFSNINWGAGKHFLKVEIDKNAGTNYVTMSNQQLLSVPYALYSDKSTYATSAGNGIASVSDNGNGSLTFTYTDGSTYTTPILTGLQGIQGATGAQGPAGQNGTDGINGTNGANGQNGLSAYEIWLAQGNTGTESDFLNSVTTGAQGIPGQNGANGQNGLSAYQIWLSQGNTGTESDFLTSIIGAVGAQGSQGVAGSNGSNGADGKNTLAKTTTETAGANCTTGGMKVEYGLDANNNGTLDVSEVNATLTKYVCNGSVGATGAQGPIGLTGSTGAQGIQGATGAQGPIGLTGPTGATGAQGIQGAAGAAGTNGLDGKNTLAKTTNEAAGANCTTGGVKIEYGLDANNNGTLDVSEVNATLTKYICNGSVGATGAQGPIGLTGATGAQGIQGATGAAGTNGSAGVAGKNTLAKTTTEAAGANCTTGGVKVEYGLDANNNGTLDVSEVNASLTKYVCNGSVGATGAQGPIGLTGATGATGAQGIQGATGAAGTNGTNGTIGLDGKNTLAKTTTEVAGANCTTGGVKIEYGLDANNNGTLDISEVNATLTKYVCNGTVGATGAQGIQGPIGLNGPTGVTGAQGIPGVAGATGTNGTNGTNGADGKNTLAKTTTESAGANCTTGGVKIEYGLDANNNGTLDVSEVNATLTKYVCNGAQGTPGSQNAWSLTGNTGTNPTTNFIGTTDSQDFVLKTNNTERMRITSTGNLGIGTSSPLTQFHLVGTLTSQTSITNNIFRQTYDNNSVSRYSERLNISGSNTQLDIDPFSTDASGNLTFRFFRNSNTNGSKLVQFLRGNGTTQGSVQIGIDGATSYFQLQGGNFGIGTATPLGKLHVNNDVSGSDSSFVVTTDGKVGIGTTSPTDKVVIEQGGMRINGKFGIGFNDDSFSNSSPNGWEGAKIYWEEGTINTSLPNSDYLVLEKKDGNSLIPDGGIAFANRGNDGNRKMSMVVSGNGSLGLGTLNPLGKFHVNNDVTGSDSSFIVTTDGKVGIGTSSPLCPLTIRSSINIPNTVMADLGNSISDGNFRLVTTKGVGTNNVGDAVMNFSMIYGNSGSTISSSIKFHRGTLGNDGSISFTTNNDAVEIMRLANVANTGRVGIGTASPDQILSVNGNASKAGGGSWATFSDMRVKHDIKPFKDGLEVLMKLNPVTFKYNEKSGYTDVNKSFVGFIAQDVETVAPYMVNLYDDSSGPSGLSDKRQFDESALNKILVNAVQEQQVQIEQLKRELEEMKLYIKDLKKN